MMEDNDNNITNNSEIKLIEVIMITKIHILD